MPLTNYFKNEILNFNFGETSYYPSDMSSQLWFGLSLTEVTAEDNGGDTVTEPTAGSYERMYFCNGLPIMNGLALEYTGKNVTFTVDNTGALDAGDIVTIAGVNIGFSVTNIDGTWVLTNVGGGGQLSFTVANQPVGATPQTLSVGTARCANWSESTAGSLYNNKTVTFDPSGAGDPWSTPGAPIVSVFIADAQIGGAFNVLSFYTLPYPLVVPELTTVSLPVQSILVSEPITNGTLFTTNRVLNYNFGGVPYIPDDGSNQLYFGLSTTVVTAAGLSTVTEPPAAAGYSRFTISNTGSGWNASTGVNPPSGVTNIPVVDFCPSPPPSASWGVVRSYFISDSAAIGAGNILWYKTLSPSIIIQESMGDIYFGTSVITIL